MEVLKKLQELFSHKVRETMKLRKNNAIDGTVNVDQFVIRGRQKSKGGKS